MSETITKILKFISDNHLFSGISHVLCAVSGGADSMALLHILSSNMSLFGLKTVSAFHLNHNIRGLEADSDEEYVGQFCLSHSIPFYSYKLNTEETNNANEESLRELRYHYLDFYCKYIGADCIVTGHTLSDQAETFLLNLGRGTGLKGLSGIPSKRDNIIRPLLCISRDETEKYCEENNIVYRIDSTNNEDLYKRNYIRHHIVPELDSLFGNIEEKLNNTAIAADEADSYIRKLAYCALDKCKNGVTSLNALQLLNEDTVLQKYVLMLFLAENGIPYDYADISNLIYILNNSGRLQLKKGFIAQQYNKELYIYKSDDILSIDSKRVNLGINLFSNRKSINVSLEDLSDVNKRYNNYSFFELIDYDKIIGDLIIRQWVSGDNFSSYKRNNTKSLKKLFNEKKLFPNEKYEQIVLSDDTGIVWLEGEGVSSYKAITDSTKKVLVINVITEE